jgi:hypothetical protein
MRLLKLTQEISASDIKKKMQSANSLADYKRWQIIYNVCVYSVDASYLSDITGYSKANIYSIVQSFNKSKALDVSAKQKGGRRRSLMSIEQERAYE